MTNPATPPDDDHDGYLAELGDRVRKLRALRGMSRRQLAGAAAVSERYLAQLETGRGNITLAILRRIAAAIGVPAEELVREGPQPTAEYGLLLDHLRRLDAEGIARAYALLTGAGDTSPARCQRIALVGLRGAGKTTVGAALGRRLSMPFIELVQEIEREAGRGIGAILASESQAGYRALERRALEQVTQRFERVIVATGGSLVSERATYEYLLRNYYTLWLKAEPAEHMARVIAQGDLRPMADNDQAMDDLLRILAEREPLYGLADRTIATSGKSLQATLADLLACLPVAAPAAVTEEAL